MKRDLIFIVLSIVLFCHGCDDKSSDFNNALKSIKISDLTADVSELGSDRFMGRAPFTEGEQLSVEYLANRLKNIGFEPAFDGSYFQEVPMVKLKSSVNGKVKIASQGKVFQLSSPDEITLISPRIKRDISIDRSGLVFAGFGINAPGYGWNDYDGLDVRGKTVVVMINDPGLYTGDTSLFKGPEMTYYGRWTYKYEEAARQGAQGVLIIHETKGAGYDYSVPRHSSLSPNLYMQQPDSNMSCCQFTGWIPAETAENLFFTPGRNLDELRRDACKKGFRGFDMNMDISFRIRNSIEYNKSKNVAGILRGTERPEESVVYSAHWDHFGIGEVIEGDSIYNGAVDNGTSMAWELAIGGAFSRLKNRPERSIVLLFPTAEEQGLLGAYYYTEHPALPIDKTVACINNDLLLPVGRMKDVMVSGLGQSDLDNYLERAAARQGRYITGDPHSYAGMYFRSDHFAFVRKGVPSMFARGNTDSREFGKEWALDQEVNYITNKYHKPADNYEPDKWNFEGIAEDAALAFIVGYELATSGYYPKWNSGSEFKKLRE